MKGIEDGSEDEQDFLLYVHYDGGAWPTLAHQIYMGKEKMKKGEKKEEEGGCRGRRGLGVFTRWRPLHFQLPLPRSLYIKPTLKRRRDCW